MTKFPKVSVLMTSFNREKYIAEAIDSVLNSTYANFELIIVDDCSNDNTVVIATKYTQRDPRVKLFINEENLGDYPNRNKAASYATGKYIKYLDSDDVMYPQCLEVMVTAMEKYPNAVFGLSSIGNKNFPYPINLAPRDSYSQHFGGFGHFNRAPGSAIIRREIFVKEKGFLIPKYAGDTELWFRLAQKYNLVLFPRDLVWDRCHNESQSNFERQDKNIVKFRKKLIHKFLYSPDCPLNSKEIKKIQKLERKNTIKQLIRKWL
jgi:glycosyltransferase involved in cell wall biosynthesis